MNYLPVLAFPLYWVRLSAGILLGVSGFGIIEVNDVLKVLAEIGILLLLFEIGLDTDIRRLRDAGAKSTIVALFGAAFPFTISALVAYYLFDLTLVVFSFYRRYSDCNEYRDNDESIKRSSKRTFKYCTDRHWCSSNR